VLKQYGACMHKILKIKSVIDDFTMHLLGGIKVGLDIFILAILPQLKYMEIVLSSSSSILPLVSVVPLHIVKRSTMSSVGAEIVISNNFWHTKLK
jgi:hypothetical protein